MLEIVAEIKAEAERELLLAKAKIEVAESIERKYLERQSESTEAVSDFESTDDYESAEGEESELNNI